MRGPVAPISIVGESCLMQILHKRVIFRGFGLLQICNDPSPGPERPPPLILQVFWVKFWKGWVVGGPDIPLAHQREEVGVAVLQAGPVGGAVGRRHTGQVTITDPTISPHMRAGLTLAPWGSWVLESSWR